MASDKVVLNIVDNRPGKPVGTVTITAEMCKPLRSHQGLLDSASLHLIELEAALRELEAFELRYHHDHGLDEICALVRVGCEKLREKLAGMT